MPSLVSSSIGDSLSRALIQKSLDFKSLDCGKTLIWLLASAKNPFIWCPKKRPNWFLTIDLRSKLRGGPFYSEVGAWLAMCNLLLCVTKRSFSSFLSDRYRQIYYRLHEHVLVSILRCPTHQPRLQNEKCPRFHIGHRPPLSVTTQQKRVVPRWCKLGFDVKTQIESLTFRKSRCKKATLKFVAIFLLHPITQQKSLFLRVITSSK